MIQIKSYALVDEDAMHPTYTMKSLPITNNSILVMMNRNGWPSVAIVSLDSRRAVTIRGTMIRFKEGEGEVAQAEVLAEMGFSSSLVMVLELVVGLALCAAADSWYFLLRPNLFSFLVWCTLPDRFGCWCFLVNISAYMFTSASACGGGGGGGGGEALTLLRRIVLSYTGFQSSLLKHSIARFNF